MLRKSCRLLLKNNGIRSRWTDRLECSVWVYMRNVQLVLLTCIFQRCLRSFLLAWIHHGFINDWPAICWYAVNLAGVEFHFVVIRSGLLEVSPTQTCFILLSVLENCIPVLHVASLLKMNKPGGGGQRESPNVFQWCFHVLTSSGWMDAFCVLTCAAPKSKLTNRNEALHSHICILVLAHKWDSDMTTAHIRLMNFILFYLFIFRNVGSLYLRD